MASVTIVLERKCYSAEDIKLYCDILNLYGNFKVNKKDYSPFCRIM